MANSQGDPKSIRIGVFDTVENADRALSSLQQAGFGENELSVLCSNETQAKHFPPSLVDGEDGDTAKASAAGSVIGALLAGAGVGVAGLATTAGLPVIAIGAMGAAMAGGVAGGLTGAMAERGFEPQSADYFDQAVTEGKILISVESENSDPARLKLANEILRDAGAEPISLLET